MAEKSAFFIFATIELVITFMYNKSIKNIVMQGETMSKKNTSSIKATSFTLTPQVRKTFNDVNTTTASNVDVCDQIDVEIKAGQNVIYNGTAKNLTASINLLQKLNKQEIAPNEAVDITFKTTLKSSATSAHAGKTVSQPLVWQFQG